jgi:uncharacterized zinc-type alcohol dehydrogenase-like protein
VIISTSDEEMHLHAGSFVFILDTIAAEHDINAYINMLTLDGNITLVGAPETRFWSRPSPCRSVAAS